MKVEDIFNEYGWQYIDNRQQNENILFLSFIDILKEEEKDDKSE